MWGKLKGERALRVPSGVTHSHVTAPPHVSCPPLVCHLRPSWSLSLLLSKGPSPFPCSAGGVLSSSLPRAVSGPVSRLLHLPLATSPGPPPGPGARGRPFPTHPAPNLGGALARRPAGRRSGVGGTRRLCARGSEPRQPLPSCAAGTPRTREQSPRRPRRPSLTCPRSSPRSSCPGLAGQRKGHF